MSGEVDPRLARLKRLPVRLRIVHLVALLRWERAVSSPSPAERGEGGRRQATVGWGRDIEKLRSR
jgi:hypothetical protein